jgi:ActR/RegA family two-component response regulator
MPELLRVLEEAVRDAGSVLIVDDDEPFLSSLADALRARAVPVRAARVLDEALDELARDPPKAVLLHLRIALDESRRYIVAIKSVTPATLLVLYSGRPTELRRTLDATAPSLVDAVFTKPLPIERLLETLDGK